MPGEASSTEGLREGGVMGKRIVVVEDDVLLSTTVSIGLQNRGHSVSVFHRGTDAAVHVSEEKPDALVLDIRLPDCDGWSLAKFLKRLDLVDGIPLVIMSALEPERKMMAEVRPYAYVQKPFDMGQLMATVERGLSEHMCSVTM